MHDVHSLISMHFFVVGTWLQLAPKTSYSYFYGIFSEYWEIIKGKKSKWIFTI